MPFLDKEFINVAMAIDPEWKMVNLFYLVLCFFFFFSGINLFMYQHQVIRFQCLLIGFFLYFPIILD